MNENMRAASGLMTNLSGFIITANLSMLAIQGASYVFVAGHDGMITTTYNILSIGAFLLFVISIILGGKGITETANQLAAGKWTITTASSKFNKQAICSFIGVLLFLVASVFFIGEKEDGSGKNEIAVELRSINESIASLDLSISCDSTPHTKNAIHEQLEELQSILFNQMSKSNCASLDTEVLGGNLTCPGGTYFSGAVKHPSPNGTLDKILCCER